MKRITYISHLTPDVDSKALEHIGDVSVRNNRKLQVTGTLVYAAGIFFQIIEGEDATLDALYQRIAQDTRHYGVMCLRTEYNISERLFPDWAMQTINLDASQDAVIWPFKALLQRLGEAYHIVHQYTPPTVAEMLNDGLNPLQVAPHRSEKVILFADMLAFSSLAEQLPVEQVTELVNRYLDICSTAVQQYQGDVSKYIGDCVMAHFETTQADAAIAAALSILEQLAEARQGADVNDPASVLYSGIGLAAGMVMEGNFGSRSKVDYTIIGDAVNSASRVEGLTRQCGYPLLFSDDVKRLCRQTHGFIEAGQFQVKGRTSVVPVFSLHRQLFDAHHMTNASARIAAYLQRR
jgi:class 3 adenylate cyclase